MAGLLHLVQRGGAWAGWVLAQRHIILCGTIIALDSKGLRMLLYSAGELSPGGGGFSLNRNLRGMYLGR